MPYAYRFLTDEQRVEIGRRATTPPAAAPPDEATQRAWEADLAGHQALLSAASTAESRATHSKAVKTLETALNKAAQRSQ